MASAKLSVSPLQEHLTVFIHALKECKKRQSNNCPFPAGCQLARILARHLTKTCRGEQCKAVPKCYETRKLLTHWLNCTEKDCHICPVLSKPKATYEVSDLALPRYVEKETKNWRASISKKQRLDFARQIRMASLSLTDTYFDDFFAAYFEYEAFEIAQNKKVYLKLIETKLKELEAKNETPICPTINIDFEPDWLLATGNSGACAILADHCVRSIPTQPRQLYLSSIKTTCLGPIKHKITLYQVILEPDQKHIFPHKVLERNCGGFVNNLLYTFIVDEILKKIYLSICYADKTPHLRVNKFEIREYDFEFDDKIDRKGYRKFCSVVERKQSQITIELGLPELAMAKLLIYPLDGSLMVHAAQLIKGETHQSIGWLYRKQKTDRAMHFSSTKSFIAGFNSQVWYETDPKSKLLHTIMYGNKPQGSFEIQSADVAFRIGYDPTFFLKQLSITNWNSPDTVYRWLPLEARKKLYQNFEFERTHVYKKYIQENVNPLGFMYKLFLIRISDIVIGLKRHKDSLTVFGGPQDVKVLINLPSLVKEADMLFIRPNLIVEVHDNIGLRQLSLTNSKYSPTLKGYRTCAKCGNMEKRKRKNKLGKRIAHFKVCRPCKKRNYHHNPIHFPCYYCSLKCLRAHWPTHKKQHQEDQSP